MHISPRGGLPQILVDTASCKSDSTVGDHEEYFSGVASQLGNGSNLWPAGSCPVVTLGAI